MTDIVNHGSQLVPLLPSLPFLAIFAGISTIGRKS
jgi:hypothetical protein